MATRDCPDQDWIEQIAAARAVMAAHLSALNAQNPDALAATMHFPHYRLSGGVMRTWETPDTYLVDFHQRASGEWHHTRWDSIEVLMASEDKVHLDVRFTRFRADDSVLAQHRSLWVISELEGVWAAQLRSSFAP
jgi:hypothetical protein